MSNNKNNNNIQVGKRAFSNADFLRQLSIPRASSSSKNNNIRVELIKNATDDQLLTLVESCYNIIRSRVPLSCTQRRVLSRNAGDIRRLSRARTPQSARTQLLRTERRSHRRCCHKRQSGRGLPPLLDEQLKVQQHQTLPSQIEHDNVFKRHFSRGHKALSDIYANPQSSACFTSTRPILAALAKKNPSQITEINRKAVEQFLHSLPAYTRHRRIVRRFPRLPTIALGLHTDWHADLADFQRICGANRGFRYLLVCIDCLSRQLFVEPLRRKTANEMLQAFKAIFTRSKFIPWRIYTDHGLEFRNAPVQKLFHVHGISHRLMHTSPKIHASMAERVIQTLKGRLWRYFTHHRTHRWLDVIQQLAGAINSSPHSALPGGMGPADVTFANVQAVRRQLWARAGLQTASIMATAIAVNKKLCGRPPLKVGDRVRIESNKHVFEKGYIPRFSDEIFRITRVRQGDNRLAPSLPITYRIAEESNDDPVPGWFYKNELSRVH